MATVRPQTSEMISLIRAAVGRGVPTERVPNRVTPGYKHLAPLGRNPTA
jgi:hypothetical protein